MDEDLKNKIQEYINECVDANIPLEDIKKGIKEKFNVDIGVEEEDPYKYTQEKMEELLKILPEKLKKTIAKFNLISSTYRIGKPHDVELYRADFFKPFKNLEDYLDKLKENLIEEGKELKN